MPHRAKSHPSLADGRGAERRLQGEPLTASAISAGGAFSRLTLLPRLVYIEAESRYNGDHIAGRKVLDAPDGKRPLTPHEAIPKGRLKGRVRETLAGMKGWRPSALAKGSKTGSGFLRGRNSAGHRIEPLSFPLLLGPRVRAGSHGYRLHGAGRPPSRTRRPTVRDLKNGASPSLASRDLKDPETEIMETKDRGEQGTPAQAVRMGGSRAGACAYTPCCRRVYAGAGANKIFWPWGSAQVLEKAQFGEGNPRIFLG
jgi:hypothetical protein